MTTGPKPRPALDRFMAFVSPDIATGCWLWTGARSRCGYGRFALKGGHAGGLAPAHRAAWLLFRGDIPAGLEVAHACDVRLCVNPAHLWVATHAENMADMLRKGRKGDSRVFGDRNGSRTKPERRPRGAAHWTHRRKELTS
jgi:hypothetical protein